MDSDLNIFLNALRNAINNDPNQFNRAKTDSMYDVFRPQVDALLNEMYQEVKKNAEKEYRDLEYLKQKMKKWFDNNYSNSNDKQKYENVRTELLTVRNQIETNDYVWYVKAINDMVNIRKTIVEIQKSIKNDLDSMRKELSLKNNDDIKPLIRDAYNKKNRLISKNRTSLYVKIIICWGVLIALVFSNITCGDKSTGALLNIVFMTLAISALGALLDDDGSFISGFFVLIGPSFIVLLVSCVILLIIGLVIEIMFGETIVDIFALLIILVPVLGLIFGPFLAKNNVLVSEISKTEKNILSLKNNENAKNEHIKNLQQKIQTAKESLQ